LWLNLWDEKQGKMVKFDKGKIKKPFWQTITPKGLSHERYGMTDVYIIPPIPPPIP
jgi:hypothetical protein